MVKVGFIVEGDSEKIIVESFQFKQMLAENDCELVEPVVNAKGGGNLLPQYMEEHVRILHNNNVDEIFVLTDLEDEENVQTVRGRINHPSVAVIFVAIKALEAWYLADSNAMQQWLNSSTFSENEPENTTGMPWERLKEIAANLGVRGPGSKVSFSKKMTKHYGFDVREAASHPSCLSAKELLDYFAR